MLPWKNKRFLSIKEELGKYTKRAYFVGGCVRDSLFGIKTNDYDIEIYDVSPEQLEEIVKKLAGFGCGKSFFVYKVGRFDLALARTEKKIGNLHTDFEVFIESDELKGSLRRDFCMNTIMVNIFDKSILDLHGGISDCKNRKIRIVNYDTFNEDSLRVLRFLQFISRFGLKVIKQDLDYMKKISIANLSTERISNELLKLFYGKCPELGLYYLFKLGLQQEIFGVTLGRFEYLKILQKIKKNKNLVNKDKRHALFYFYLLEYFTYKKLEAKIKARKLFSFLKTEPFIKKIDDFSLCKIACNMPLKDWLGLDEDTKKRAKELGIYKKKLKIIYNNISKAEDAKREQEQQIKEYLNNV